MSLLVLDTSAAVPLLFSSHDAHRVVTYYLGKRTVSIAVHSALETYSVLTRLPGDARHAPADAALLLADRFGTPVALDHEIAAGLVGDFARLGIAGGAVYDALIAVTAKAAGGVLLTRDRRAAATYAQLAVDCELIGG